MTHIREWGKDITLEKGTDLFSSILSWSALLSVFNPPPNDGLYFIGKSPFMPKHDEHIEHSKCCSGHGEEVHRGKILDMVAEF